MNWKNRLRRVEEDADDDDGDGEENDDDDGDDDDDEDDDDDDNDDDDDDDDDYYDGYEGVLNSGLAEFRLLFLRSFERETRCSERFPRRRGRLDKAEEAE